MVPYSALDQLGVDGALPVDIDFVVWEHGEGAHPWLMAVSICWTLAWISRLVVKPTTKIDKDVPD